MAENQHDNIINVLHYNLDNVPPYFIMPIANGNLWQLLDKLKGNTIAILKVFNTICTGVAGLHDAGAYHRDINPDNVLYFEEDRVVVADLGLARKIERGSAIHNSSKGTYGWAFYVAPEQIEALENADERSDVYQLGKTLYAMLTNRHPSSMNAGAVSPGLFHIIQTATRDNPDERYQTVKELQKAVLEYLPALDRLANPVSAFGELMNDVNKSSKRGRLKIEMCLPLLDALSKVQNDAIMLGRFFEQLNDQVLKVVLPELDTEFLPILRRFQDAIPEYVQHEKRGKHEYADTIVQQMKLVFENATSHESKRIALEISIEYACYFNRWAAMIVVNKILQSVKDDDVALMVAGQLRRQQRCYVGFYNNIPKGTLHFHIAQVYEEVANDQAEKDKQSPDTTEY